jgi:hypothetical protein
VFTGIWPTDIWSPLVTGTVTDADDRPHRPGGDPSWCETWSFDGWIGAADLGVVVELTWLPHHRVAWYAAALVGRSRPYVLVSAGDIPMARPTASLELRHEGIWAQHVCETPHDHWTIGLEAFGVALDDPADALAGAFGDLTGLGLDVEWEAAGPIDVLAAGSYRQPCRVYGEVLVGAEVHGDVAGVGWRRHRWGPWGPSGWWGLWSADGSVPLTTAPISGAGTRLVADAPVAVEGPAGLGWRERRSVVETDDSRGWLASSL